MTVLALVESGDSRVECGAVGAQCTGKVTYIAVSAVKLVMCGDTGAEAGEPGAFCTGLIIGGTIQERPDVAAAVGASDVKTGIADVTEGPDATNGSGRIVSVAAGDVTEGPDATDGSGRALNQLELGPLIAIFNAIIDDQYENPGSKTPLQLSQELQAEYISYGKTGSVPGVDIVAGGNPPSLNPAFFADNTAAGIDRIADNVAAYWQTVITPGAPAHGGTVVLSVQVVPDVPALRAAIVEASTAPETAPGGTTNVLTAIQRELKTWDFIITERVAGLPVSFFESII